jgi:hypothetical protein
MDEADTIAALAELLRCELRLPEEPPHVFVYNGAWNLPELDDMYLYIGILRDDVFAAGQNYANDPVAEQLVEQQRISRSTTYTVDLFSVSTEARRRRFDVTFALQGDAAERLSEARCLRIFRPSNFTDLSDIEASRRLNRFQCQFDVFESAGQTRSVPFMIPQPAPALSIQP